MHERGKRDRLLVRKRERLWPTNMQLDIDYSSKYPLPEEGNSSEKYRKDRPWKFQ
jgi:hypothetical protein